MCGAAAVGWDAPRLASHAAIAAGTFSFRKREPWLPPEIRIDGTALAVRVARARRVFLEAREHARPDRVARQHRASGREVGPAALEGDEHATHQLAEEPVGEPGRGVLLPGSRWAGAPAPSAASPAPTRSHRRRAPRGRVQLAQHRAGVVDAESTRPSERIFARTPPPATAPARTAKKRWPSRTSRASTPLVVPANATARSLPPWSQRSAIPTPGKRWPPVPPPATRSLTSAPPPRRERGGVPIDGQHEAERDRAREQRRAAVAQEWQRQPLGRDQPEGHGHVGRRLQADEAGEPRRQQVTEAIARRQRHARALHDQQEEERGHARDFDEAHLLAEDREHEVGVALRR